jgi:hypothetical protein
MRSFRRVAVALTAVVLLLGAPACGSDDDDRGGGPVDPPPPPPPVQSLAVAGGGDNVAERFTSDLWVHGSFAYSGTWGSFPRGNTLGNALKIWSLDASGAPALADSIIVPGISTVSDVEVSADGAVLMFSAEGAEKAGLYLYSLADPATPTFLDSALVEPGLHTATFGEIGSGRYAFTAKNPPDPALLIFDVTDPADISLATTVPIPADYGIHDTYVREGLAFVFAWNTGVIIYDVGNGIRGGSVSAPVEVGRAVTEGGATHNGWWFHNPVTEEKRYLFVGEEGPGTVGASASGDIHVLDVSDLTAPREVATFSVPGAGAHNFWMDESREVLYAAYYNGGVVALDVSGTLSGDLSDRLIDRLKPGGDDDTYTWSVMLSNGSLYASDMISGLWQLEVETTTAGE